MSNITLIVSRVNNDKFNISKPCMHCTNLIKMVGIKYIVYSDIDGYFIKEYVRELNTNHVSGLKKRNTLQ